ncbi:MAG: hypothetical protein K0R63_1331 [Rickettsiales bacterium]|jgi:hypothetical protein|nr:hypothetical protein [Rickettsiales bacterium]
MSDELQFPNNTRLLKKDEKELLRAMLKGFPQKQKFLGHIETYLVKDLADGGMGSFRFIYNKKQQTFGDTIAKAEYLDEDGVIVSIALNVDTDGDLYEMDIWKVDFSKLKRYPTSDIKLLT